MNKLPAKEIALYEKKLRQTGNDFLARKSFELFKITGNEQWKNIIETRTIPQLHHDAIMNSLDPFYYPERELIKVSEGFLILGFPIING